MSKFKLNWGYLVVIGLGSFILFILSLMFLAGDTGELVTEDYYQHSLDYQEEIIDASHRTQELNNKPRLKLQANGILVSFPTEYQVEKGEVSLTRGANSSEDVIIPIKQGAKEVLIPAVRLKTGEYDMVLKWYLNTEPYLIKKTIEWTSP